MRYELHYVAQLKDTKTGEVVKQTLLQQCPIKKANTIDEFGLRHREQIALIKSSQDVLLELQCDLLDDAITCPQCGKKLRHQGHATSDFHDVFTDHKVKIAKLTCSCNWKNNSSINSVYGNASHPELVKLQAETGARESFQRASGILNAGCGMKRKINNDVTIMKQVGKVGERLDSLKKSATWCENKSVADSLTLTTDGGHVQNHEVGKQSFEELISTVYKPEDRESIGKDHWRLTNKLSVGSAKSDAQKTIKQQTLNACKKMGMTQQTDMTALCDGASNCWSVIESITPHCKALTSILDWFHIGKKFKERESKIPQEQRDRYDRAKWHLWHGHPDTSMIRLQQVQAALTDTVAKDKVQELLNYVDNNRDYIVKYHFRRLNHQVYTSQLAETSVNSLINARQKNKKMQWTREGAHHVLQIRTSLYSDNWLNDWRVVKQELYKEAA